MDQGGREKAEKEGKGREREMKDCMRREYM